MRRTDCDRARRSAALAPDGELAEVERRFLRSHVAACAACADYAADVAATATMLRGVELERPTQPVVLRLPSRRRSAVARLRPVAAAAAVALMALGVASRAPLPVEERSSALRATVPATQDDHVEMQALRERRQVLTVSPEDRAVIERPVAV